MKYTLYDIALHILIILLTPYFAFKMVFARKYRSGISERFGFIDQRKTRALAGNEVIWIHAVSVGETKAVLPVLKLFKGRNPRVKIVFSTTTQTGNQVAAYEGRDLIDTLIYFPLDISWTIKRVARRVSPRVFIVVEKEIWPNIFKFMEAAGVPIIVVNGTISDRSFMRFKRFKRFFGDVFGQVDYYCARTEEDLIKALDSGVAAENAGTIGNIKFDLTPPSADRKTLDSLREDLGISPGDLVVVAGSTHEGEEKIVIDAFKAIVSDIPKAKLVLAPRHPERFDSVESLLKSSGLRYKRRTRSGAGDVVLLDTVGELMHAYSFATVAVVGGSLVPDIGGHNLLEPAYYGKPVVYGKHLSTYLLMAEMLEARGGGSRVKDGENLKKVLKEFLTDEVSRKRVGTAAKAFVDENRGAAMRTVEVIEKFLPRTEKKSR